LAAEDLAASALCGVMEKALIAEGVAPPFAKILAERACQPVVRSGTRKAVKGAKRAGRSVKRKASKYQTRFGTELKRLKKKHPRTKITALMKRAHTATKKAMK